MKTLTDTNTTIKAIDFELKQLLLKDLAQFKAKENKQVVVQKAA